MSEIQYILLHHNISAFLQNFLLSQLLLYTPEQSETIKKIVIQLPVKPNSSPITANIKSFWASAIYPAFFKEDVSLLLRPLP